MVTLPNVDLIKESKSSEQEEGRKDGAATRYDILSKTRALTSEMVKQEMDKELPQFRKTVYKYLYENTRDRMMPCKFYNQPSGCKETEETHEKKRPAGARVYRHICSDCYEVTGLVGGHNCESRHCPIQKYKIRMVTK